MSNELKRVGLAFDEEGSVKFVKTLKEVNSAISDNNLEFKKAQAQWDKTTPATEKLKFQIDNLGKAIELQKEKSTALREEINKLENAEESNTKTNKKNQEQLQKKRKELEKTELKIISYTKKVEDMKNQLENTGKKWEENGLKIEKFGNKIEKAGNKLSAFSAATASALVASAKTAIDFESAFAGVEKTVDGTAEQMAELKQGIRDMAKEIPSSTTEISAVAEAAGQLGIKTEDILSFTRVMIDLGNSTNLSAEEAASSLAKFANVTKMSAKDYDKLGSTIVALGNNFATTEADIVAMATRLAATGELAGLSQSQILSLATAMSSVGIEAEAGGSAMSKLLKQIQVATETGGEELNNFAKVAGISGKDFKEAFEKDAVNALTLFISGLNDTERNGKTAISVLDSMGIKEVRLSNTILSLANASDVMTKAVNLGSEAWEDNTALTNEANKRYGTLESKIKIVINKLKDLAITFGNKLLPELNEGIKLIERITNRISKLSDKEINQILNIGKIVIAIGTLTKILGKTISGIGTAINAVGKFINVLEVASGTATSTSIAINLMAKVIKGITSPVGMACSLVGLAIAGIAISAQSSAKDTKEAFSNMGNSATDFIKGIDSATSHLDSFNSTLFASAEEQQKLQEDMDKIQEGITQICKIASDERRGYTQEEITQLDEYFTKLRELKNRELEIQKSISNAITQQAQQNAETFQGSLEEYKVQSQEWIKTAEEQASKEIAIINDRTTQEIALLQQRYGEKATLENEEYAREYNLIQENKNKAIQEANDEVGKVNLAYSNGYLERSKQEDGFYNTLKDYMKKQEALATSHNQKIEQIKNDELWYVTDKNGAIRSENETFAFHQKNIWDQMYANMSEEQAKELGTWLAMVSQTEMYGGEIENETKNMVDSIINSYDTMPEDAKKAMKQTMEGMLKGIQEKEPSLFAKATGIAEGILTRLRKSFDIHSPSRKTRQIMKFAMQPMEEEMEKGKEELFKQADEIGDGITNRLEDINGNADINDAEGKLNQNSNLFTISYDKIAETIALATNNTNQKIIDLLTKILEKSGKSIVLDTGQLVGATSDAYDVALADNQTRRKRGN